MAEITVMRTTAEQTLGEQFRGLHAAAPSREAAFAAFAAKGLPHRRIEAWHYTDLRSLLREAFPPAAAPGEALVAKARAAVSALPPSVGRVVFLDGALVASLSTLAALPAGVAISDLLAGAPPAQTPSDHLQAAERLGAGEAVLALNTAFLQGGVAIAIASGAQLQAPLEVVSIVSAETPAAVSTRVLVEVGDGAVATLVERHICLGTANVQGNHAVVMAVGEGAVFDHRCTVEGFTDGALHVGSVLARIAGNARLGSFTLAAAKGVVRRQSFVEFVGEHSASRFNGVTLLEGRAHADTTLLVTHTAPHCESREYYKTILDDEATGVYQGKVVVAPGAQKTDGKMLSKAIFLADGASMYNKPELEIFADDVVCGHGATVGYLDEDQLFYLRARGIPRAEAQSLLLNAFAADAIEMVEDEAAREALAHTVERWLARRHL